MLMFHNCSGGAEAGIAARADFLNSWCMVSPNVGAYSHFVAAVGNSAGLGATALVGNWRADTPGFGPPGGDGVLDRQLAPSGWVARSRAPLRAAGDGLAAGRRWQLHLLWVGAPVLTLAPGARDPIRPLKHQTVDRSSEGQGCAADWELPAFPGPHLSMRSADHNRCQSDPNEHARTLYPVAVAEMAHPSPPRAI